MLRWMRRSRDGGCKPGQEEEGACIDPSTHSPITLTLTLTQLKRGRRLHRPLSFFLQGLEFFFFFCPSKCKCSSASVQMHLFKCTCSSSRGGIHFLEIYSFFRICDFFILYIKGGGYIILKISNSKKRKIFLTSDNYLILKRNFDFGASNRVFASCTCTHTLLHLNSCTCVLVCKRCGWDRENVRRKFEIK
jgi:hypothetical protein